MLINTFFCSVSKYFKVLDGCLKEVVTCSTDISTVGADFFKKFMHFRPNIFFRTVGKNTELVHPPDKRQAIIHFCCELPWLLIAADADRSQCLGNIAAVGNNHLFNSQCPAAGVVADLESQIVEAGVNFTIIGSAEFLV